MFGKNIFAKFFGCQDSESLKLEQQLKEMTVNDVVREVNIKNTENKIEMSEELKKNEAETIEVLDTVQEEIVAVDNVEENTEVEETVNEDAQEDVSEETEVVNETELVEEQPKVEEEGNEPPAEQPVETPEVEEKEEGQEEPQEPVEEEKEVEEAEKVEIPEEVIEEPSNEVELPTATDKVELPENIVKPEIVNDFANEKAELLKEIENLKAEKAEKEVEMAKMALSKEIEEQFAGVPGKIEDKVEMIYEIKNSALSEDSKQFILNSLKSLSAQNVEDCQEIGVNNEVEVDETKEREDKIQNAIKEHGLTYNQAFLYVNGDRTLKQAKDASNKIQNKKSK